MAKLLLSFPQRVYNVLNLCEERGREDIISWENNGTAFKVNDKEEFQRDLLPRYFNTKNYNTFTRALYAHGFACVRTGRKPGIYSHPNFNRDDPVGPSLMKRESQKRKKKEAAPDHAVSSNPQSPAGILNDQPTCPFPLQTGHTDDDDAATVFGRPYHTILSQGADRVTSLPVQIPLGTELMGMFDDDDDDDFM